MAIGGGVLALVGFIVMLFLGYHGIAAGIGISLPIAGGVCLIVFGVTKFLEKEWKIWIPGAAAGAALLLFTVIGPPMSESIKEGQENDAFYAAKSTNDPAEWDRIYFAEVPFEFQRPEAHVERMKAEVIVAKANEDVVALRDIIKRVETDHAGEAAYKPVKKLAGEKLSSYYDSALAKMERGAIGETGFETDPALKSAFKKFLEDLSTAPSADVYVAFTNETDLAAPEGTEEELKKYRDEINAELAQYRGNPRQSPYTHDRWADNQAPVIDDGSAFSVIYNRARRNALNTALTESFQEVFDANLLKLVPLEDGQGRDGRLVMEVSSTIYRAPSFYTYTETRPTSQTDYITHIYGLLFAIEVEWQFKLIDREGTVLFDEVTVSIPAQNITMDTEPGDPAWAPYSVMMDSAYYNFGRLIIGSFGMRPPPEKQSFAYTEHR